MDAFITAAALRQSLASPRPPLLIDVRRQPAYLGAADTIRGALRRDPGRVDLWKDTLPAGREVVVYCVHGHEVSQGVAKALGARYLEGGIEAWRATGGELARKAAGASSRWVTRERPKIDRIACPWLIRRFIDPQAEFLYVPVADVRRIATERDAVPYDIPDVKFSHEGERCSFDAFLKAFTLGEPALDELATIVRGADTGRLDIAPQAAGLLSVSLGLSRLYKDDHEMLEHGMVVYDALYAWCRDGKEETHTWTPEAYK
ncbi:MAG TPA: chromate resistance protein ChrB domain-containing protein [Burkholderiales bacterium]|jgi:rhodanese-related sulfurtransferase